MFQINQIINNEVYVAELKWRQILQETFIYMKLYKLQFSRGVGGGCKKLVKNRIDFEDLRCTIEMYNKISKYGNLKAGVHFLY